MALALLLEELLKRILNRNVRIAIIMKMAGSLPWSNARLRDVLAGSPGGSANL